MKENEMTEAESLSIISGMINKARNRFSETGTLYLLWGWVILFCCLTQFISLRFFNYEKSYMVWFLTWAAFAYQVFYLARMKKKVRVKTYTDDILSFVWITFIACSAILMYLLITNEAYTSMHPAILVLYGMPTFLSGIILKFRPLILGGLCCWLLAILSPLVPKEYHLLLIAAAVIIAWIIPGYLLRSRFKKEN